MRLSLVRLRSDACVRRGLAIAAFGAAAVAQDPLLRRTDEMIPPGRRSPFAVVDADFDGDDDLVGTSPMFSEEGRYAELPGVFLLSTSYETSGPSPWAVVRDLNGDGAAEVLVNNGGFGNTSFSYQIGVPGGGLLPGIFTPPGAPAPWSAVAAGDVDGDGDLDLVAARWFGGGVASPLSLWINDGVGGFTDGSATSGLATLAARALRVEDLDGDGSADVVVEIDGGGVAVQRASGGGAFAPAVWASTAPSGGGILAFRTSLGDVDGDGLIDVATVIAGSTPLAIAPSVELHRQLPGFTFVPVGATPVAPYGDQPAPAAALLDLDADGDAELLVAGRDGCAAWNVVGGMLVGPTAWVDAPAHALFTLDADGDGDLDAAAMVRASPFAADYRLLFADGSGTPAAVPTPAAARWHENGSRPLLVDIDGDGDLDDVSYSGGGGVGELLIARNDGFGMFTRRAPAPCTGCLALGTPIVGSPAAAAVAVADVDADGDLDVAVSNLAGGVMQVLLNDGTGAFTAVTTPTGLGQVRAAAWADVDGDGLPDHVEARAYAGAGTAPSLLVRLNLGGGVLAAPTAPPVLPGGASDLVARDLDADGDVDLVAVFPTVGLGLAMNQGGGVFVAGAAPAMAQSGPQITVVDAGDYDADGDLDLCWGRQVRIQTGPGVFGGFVFAGGLVGHVASRFADADDDGDLDVLYWFGAASGTAWIQSGGLLTPGSAIGAPLLGAALNAVPAVGDVDGDGDPDLLSWNGTVAFNASRQLGRLLPLRLGATASAEVLGPPAGYAVLAAGVEATPHATTSFGALALDPASAVVVGAAPLDAEGRAVFSGFVPVSAGPALLGIDFLFQALVDGPDGPRLTAARRAPVFVY
ncbi:MAG TPA: VCBS repeat-containing protein [Planctomycetota bacterium]|nr:VCBS repeat-containing protein [Planctomycetota bacterium]